MVKRLPMNKRVNRTFVMTPEELIRICKCKHYRVGYEGMAHYGELKRKLAELGLSEDEIKQCLHP